MNKEQVLEILNKCIETVNALPFPPLSITIDEDEAKILIGSYSYEDKFMDYTKDMPRTFEPYDRDGVDTGEEFVTATTDNGVKLIILRDVRKRT